jgi:transposase
MRSIDVHAHLTPQCFWQETEHDGDWHTILREKDARGQECAIVDNRRQVLPPRARWTPEERIADMDSLGVDMQVVSPYVGFYNYHLDTAVAAATARATNDEIAQMTRRWPQRFAGLGTLPGRAFMANQVRPIEVTAAERAELERLPRASSTPAGLSRRVRAVLLMMQGGREIAERIGYTVVQVSRIRRRFAEGGVPGPKSGRPPTITARKRAQIVALTLEPPGGERTHWTTRDLGRTARVSHSTVHRIWRAHAPQPHRVTTFKFTTIPRRKRYI